jgi:hypothetical protein
MQNHMATVEQRFNNPWPRLSVAYQATGRAKIYSAVAISSFNSKRGRVESQACSGQNTFQLTSGVIIRQIH